MINRTRPRRVTCGDSGELWIRRHQRDALDAGRCRDTSGTREPKQATIGIGNDPREWIWDRVLVEGRILCERCSLPRAEDVNIPSVPEIKMRSLFSDVVAFYDNAAGQFVLNSKAPGLLVGSSVPASDGPN